MAGDWNTVLDNNKKMCTLKGAVHHANKNTKIISTPNTMINPRS